MRPEGMQPEGGDELMSFGAEAASLVLRDIDTALSLCCQWEARPDTVDERSSVGAAADFTREGDAGQGGDHEWQAGHEDTPGITGLLAMAMAACQAQRLCWKILLAHMEAQMNVHMAMTMDLHVWMRARDVWQAPVA